MGYRLMCATRTMTLRAWPFWYIAGTQHPCIDHHEEKNWPPSLVLWALDKTNSSRRWIGRDDQNNQTCFFLTTTTAIPPRNTTKTTKSRQGPVQTERFEAKNRSVDEIHRNMHPLWLAKQPKWAPGDRLGSFGFFAFVWSFLDWTKAKNKRLKTNSPSTPKRAPTPWRQPQQRTTNAP